MATTRRKFFPTLTSGESSFVADVLRKETVGGTVVLIAAVVAVIWANSPLGDVYQDIRNYELGTLDIEDWAADGALALFFYIAGLELKREFMVGSLSKPADALVPIVAALVGVIMPALIFTVVNLNGGDLRGWAISAAIDIVFALAVLAVVGSSLPHSLRAFLLTVALIASGAGYLLLNTTFAQAALVAGPLLLIWVTGVGVA